MRENQNPRAHVSVHNWALTQQVECVPHMERSYLEVWASPAWAEYMTYFPAVVREWRRKQELGQSAREGERAVTVNMLLIAREPSVLLHKAPRQKGSAEPRGVDRSALCVKGHSCHCWSGTSNHIYFSCFFLNCYILKSLFCFCTRVRNFREHEEVSDWKTSIPLWGSNFFMTPG